jgi:hypothetical protein
VGNRLAHGLGGTGHWREWLGRSKRRVNSSAVLDDLCTEEFWQMIARNWQILFCMIRIELLCRTLKRWGVSRSGTIPPPRRSRLLIFERLSTTTLLANTLLVNRTMVAWHGPKMLQCSPDAKQKAQPEDHALCCFCCKRGVSELGVTGKF